MIITMHTFGLAVLVGASTAVDLRVLGVGRQLPISSLSGFFMVMWAGFWLNAFTGVLLFAADPRTTVLFTIKLLSVAVAVGLILVIRRALANGPTTVTPAARTYAVISLLMWVIATTTGRLMAYL
ncbi:MAG: hypothetical protein HOP16_07515 [Acidobacteria bacterium]|nr:hypothetical protein [Acidobacteriota bacterium]